MSAIYRLRLLGPITAEYMGQELRVLGVTQGPGTAGYLVRQTWAAQRSELATLLWSETSDLRSRRNLTRELGLLTALLPGCFQSNQQIVQWSPASRAWVDVAAFEGLAGARPAAPAIDSARIGATQPIPGSPSAPSQTWIRHGLVEAVALYRGEFSGRAVSRRLPGV